MATKHNEETIESVNGALQGNQTSALGSSLQEDTRTSYQFHHALHTFQYHGGPLKQHAPNPQISPQQVVSHGPRMGNQTTAHHNLYPSTPQQSTLQDGCLPNPIYQLQNRDNLLPMYYTNVPPSYSTVTPNKTLASPSPTKHNRSRFEFEPEESDFLLYLALHGCAPEHMTAALNRFRSPESESNPRKWATHIQDHVRVMYNTLEKTGLTEQEGEDLAGKLADKARDNGWNMEINRTKEAALDKDMRRKLQKKRAIEDKERSALLQYRAKHGKNPTGDYCSGKEQKSAFAALRREQAGVVGEDPGYSKERLLAALLRIATG